MRLTFFVIRLFAVIAVLSVFAFMSGNAFAHERRNVGKYQFVVGFMAEPAIEGVVNGVSLRVTNTETNQPVEGLEKTLKVELTSGATSTVTDLRTVFREPGHYILELIPTRPGQYVFRFFGTIEGLNVNERFESGPGRFNDVESSQELQFPDKLPTLREITGVSQSAQQTALEVQDVASTARTIAIIGVALAVVGVALSLGSIAMARRRQ
ncbi:MAG: hypothetical protein HY667_04345 [Chloroflexi bacterium]|nr:hypothetical protein [Chloroflexota bacterium]